MSSAASTFRNRLTGTDTAHRVLAGILLVGLALRTYALGAESLWVDEVHTVLVVLDRGLANIIFILPIQDPHPPFYYVVLWIWTRATGISAVSVRALSAVLGVAAIPLAYVVATRLYDRRVGLLSALLVALSPFYVWYGREARMYALMTLLGLWSMYTLLAWMDDRPEWWRGRWSYTATTVALVYTHAFGILIPVAQNVYVSAFQDAEGVDEEWFGQWGRTQAVVGVAAIPFFYNLLGGMFGAGRFQGNVGWIPDVTPFTLWKILGSYVGRAIPPSSPFDRRSLWTVGGLDLSPVGELVTLAALGLLVWLAVQHYRAGDRADAASDDAAGESDSPTGDSPVDGQTDADESDETGATGEGAGGPDGLVEGTEAPDGGREPASAGGSRASIAPGALLACWLLVPVGALFVVSVLVTPLLFDRFTAAAGVAGLILVARAITLLTRGERQTLAAAGVVVLVLAVPLTGVYAQPHKHQWDRSVEIVEANADAGDLVIVSPAWANFTYHYYGTRDDLQYGALPSGAAGWQVTAATSDVDTVWLVVTHQNESQRDAILTSMGHAGFEQTRHDDLVDVDVYRFQRD